MLGQLDAGLGATGATCEIFALLPEILLCILKQACQLNQL